MCVGIQFEFTHPGNWVLLEGLDATITKTATLVPESLDEEVHIIRPLQFHTQVICRALLSDTLYIVVHTDTRMSDQLSCPHAASASVPHRITGPCSTAAWHVRGLKQSCLPVYERRAL